MLTIRQQRALEALCRTLVPEAFDTPATADLPAQVEARITELSPHHRRLALLALSLFASRSLSLVLIARPVPFASLTPAARDRLLQHCAAHRSSRIRLLFGSIRRLILHTHYGRPATRAQIGHEARLHDRTRKYAWEGALPDAGPVVASHARDRVRERVVPAGVREGFSMGASDTLSTRVCVIGSGVGGSIAAAVLAEAGHDVVILEEGGYFTAADFDDDESRALRHLYAENGLRSTDELNVSILQGRCAGGGSTVNWMVMLRTPEHVIEEWQRHGMDISSAEFCRAFEQFERDSDVAIVPSAAHSPVNRIILDGAARLGWHARDASINARDCMRAGSCGLGCPYDAKQGSMRTYLPRALQAGARLVCDVRAKRISRVARGFRVSCEILDRDTQRPRARLEIEADNVVVAAGAVGTPALLQQSSLSCEGVGSHLRLHPTTAVVGVYDEPVYAAAGIPLTAYCDEFLAGDDGYGHWIEAPPLSAGLAAVALPGFGAAHRAYMRQFGFLAPLIVLVRDGAPRDGSIGRVSAARERTHIHYRLGAGDRARMLDGIENAARIHFACGARSVLTLHGAETVLHGTDDLGKIRAASRRTGDPTLFSAHVNGTCRIGLDARAGGCRPDGQVYHQRGLYVMDGSLLPTAPGVNPHETIAALVMVLAQRLAAQLPRLD